jgi:hypothetical protein
LSSNIDLDMKFFSFLCACLLTTALPASELFNFGTFNPNSAVALQGSASLAPNFLSLASAQSNAVGAVWFPTKQFLVEGFDTTFEFFIAGSEGIAFVIQTGTLPALGRSGAGLGYDGIRGSVAVEFDPQSSGASDQDPGPHISIQSAGTLANSSSTTATLGYAAAPALQSSGLHTARIRYVPGSIEVFFGNPNTPLLTVPFSLETLGNLQLGQAWFGFTAANNVPTSAPYLQSWSMSLVDTPLNVALTAPLEGASFYNANSILLVASANGPDSITQVEFFEGAQSLVVATNTPYQFSWLAPLPGPYTLTAVASDAAGRRITSPPVRILIYPTEPAIGVNFMTAPNETTFALAPHERAGVVPQHYWNNAPVVANGFGALQNVRNAAGEITPVDMSYDFVARGENVSLNPALSPDHRLLRAYGANVIGTPQSNSIIQIQQIPFPVYDVIIYTDGANGDADRVSQIRAPGVGNSVFIRDAAGASFAGIYASARGVADDGPSTPAGNYVRINGLNNINLTLTNNARSASDGVRLGAINAVQIIPSVFDRNAPVAVTRGPYLQMGTPHSMIIRWRSNRPVPSRIQYGTNADDLSLSLSNADETAEHSLTLTNLEPNTKYYYAVGTLETNIVLGTNIFFWTAPVTNKPARVWILGDSGTANANAAAVRDAFLTLNEGQRVDVWLMLGDNAYNSGTDAEHQAAIFNMYTNTLPQTPLWPTIGNHETAQSHTPVSTTPYLSIFTLPQNGEAGGIPSGTERYYSFDYSDVHFVCLDSMTNDRSSNGPMANWLHADLAANTKTWTIVFFHHPPYTKGSHDSDNNGADFELVEMREKINPILESYGVDLVFSGHSHCYERSFLLKGHYGYSSTLDPSMILDPGSGDPTQPEGAPYTKASDGTIYVVGGSSGQATFGTLDHPAHYKSILELGSVILDVETDRVVGRFLRSTGVIEDNFVLVKQAAPQQASSPRLTYTTTRGNQIVLNWTARPGSRYAVQRTSTLDSPEWQTVAGPITATGSIETWATQAEGAPASFYRILELK